MLEQNLSSAATLPSVWGDSRVSRVEFGEKCGWLVMEQSGEIEVEACQLALNHLNKVRFSPEDYSLTVDAESSNIHLSTSNHPN